MARPAAFVLLNRHAGGGRAGALWGCIRHRVAEGYQITVSESGSSEDNLSAVGRALAAGTRVFLAAGGDGTVNALLNALLASRGEGRVNDLALGAVGLGSSNDFHKPWDGALDRIPCKIGLTDARLRDVGLATITALDGEVIRRWFIVSASLGVTAEGNAFFNGDDLIVRQLKRLWTGGAIAYAAVRTILRHRNLEGTLTVSGQSERVNITNLSVLKTPFLSGSLRFDTPVSPDDGLFVVNLCAGMGRLAAVRALVALARGRFVGRPRCRSWSAPRVVVEIGREAPLELDGEITRASRVSFEVLSERILVCA